jgi:cytochrome c556
MKTKARGMGSVFKKRLAALAALGFAVSGLPATLHAQTPADLNIIAVRKSGQDLVMGDFTGMVQAAKNKLPDVKPFAESAKALATWEAEFVKMFPAGTEHGDNTHALPAIWSNRAGFEQAAQKLSAAAIKLAGIAKAGDSAAFASQVRVVGEACKACHKQFKAR